MSAPLSGSSGGSPAPGFYPDPSIPGYIRYWNGSSWVPGTSRPEPQEGEPMPTPPSSAAASSAVAPPTREEPAPAEETGPVFLDEETDGGGPQAQVPAARSSDSPLPEVRPRGEVAPASGAIDWDDPSRLHGQRPEPASAWQADAARQTGFAGQSEERVSWGRGESGDEGAGGVAGTAGDPRGGWGRPADEGPSQGFAEGLTDGVDAGAAAASPGTPRSPHFPEAPGSADSPGSAGSPPRDGTFQMRAMSPEAFGQAAREAAGGPTQQPEHTVGLRRSDVATPDAGQSAPPSTPSPPSAPSSPSTPSPPSAPSVPGQGAHAQPQAPGQPQVPAQPQAPAQHQVPGQPHAQQQGTAPPGAQQQGAVPGQGAAQPSWAQQVHDLAGGASGEAPAAHGAQGAPGAEPVIPWRPPTADPFQSAQREARPAALGKRFGARLVDGVLTAAVAVAAAFPFAGQAVDHVQGKIDAVRDAGETKTVWLIDGTTGVYLAVVLGALLLFGLLYEVLPTARWGRTLGKKMFGVRVLTMEQQDKPGFGSAFKRWLTYGVLSALVIGVFNVLWCVFDRPWRQCWHDKLAGTFVSGDSGEIRL
ncbi:RDD family protein [Streptomyces winkii]|uniref:RDD family protein n=1 Tax=Streptomyces winkii TaxID=3051178 RepID=UPI0028D774E1|nr:RDD family protein [Streptomyces sp. DSM 40971]